MSLTGEPHSPAVPALDYSLSAHDLEKTFDRKPVLKGVNLAVAHGESLVITGRNGVGKSTLLRMLAGLSQPTGGRVEVRAAGSLLKGDARRAAVGYVAPDLRPYDELTARENLEIMARIRGVRLTAGAAGSLLERMGLTGDFDVPAGTLSTGQRQRLKMALALLGLPPILLLDEPGSNLDEEGRRTVAGFIEEARRRGPVIIATNDPEEIRFGERRLHLEPVDGPGARRP